MSEPVTEPVASVTGKIDTNAMIAALGGDGRIEVETASQRGTIVVVGGVARIDLALTRPVSREALVAAMKARSA